MDYKVNRPKPIRGLKEFGEGLVALLRDRVLPPFLMKPMFTWLSSDSFVPDSFTSLSADVTYAAFEDAVKFLWENRLSPEALKSVMDSEVCSGGKASGFERSEEMSESESEQSEDVIVISSTGRSIRIECQNFSWLLNSEFLKVFAPGSDYCVHDDECGAVTLDVFPYLAFLVGLSDRPIIERLSGSTNFYLSTSNASHPPAIISLIGDTSPDLQSFV